MQTQQQMETVPSSSKKATARSTTPPCAPAAVQTVRIAHTSQTLAAYSSEQWERPASAAADSVEVGEVAVASAGVQRERDVHESRVGYEFD